MPWVSPSPPGSSVPNLGITQLNFDRGLLCLRGEDGTPVALMGYLRSKLRDKYTDTVLAPAQLNQILADAFALLDELVAKKRLYRAEGGWMFETSTTA